MQACPICAERLGGGAPPPSLAETYSIDCPNCGQYRITDTLVSTIGAFDDQPIARAKLSHAVYRMQRSGEPPLLTDKTAKDITRSAELPTALEQLDNLVLSLGSAMREPGEEEHLYPNTVRARVGAVSEVGAGWVLKTAHEMELISGLFTPSLSDLACIVSATLTAAGWSRFEELQRAGAASRLAFMAMQFGDQELDRIFEEIFKPSVKRAGFSLRRVDEEPRAGLIDDKLRIEIRRSRFLIADITHANRGAYWEAGYAEGMGLPVIYTCSKAAFHSNNKAVAPHFDTNHHLTVVWDTFDLKKAGDDLAAVIRATLPESATLSDDD